MLYPNSCFGISTRNKMLLEDAQSPFVSESPCIGQDQIRFFGEGEIEDEPGYIGTSGFFGRCFAEGYNCDTEEEFDK